MKRKNNPKDPAAVSLGRRGGTATARELTAEQRKESTKRAVLSRWQKVLRTPVLEKLPKIELRIEKTIYRPKYIREEK